MVGFISSSAANHINLAQSEKKIQPRKQNGWISFSALVFVNPSTCNKTWKKATPRSAYPRYWQEGPTAVLTLTCATPECASLSPPSVCIYRVCSGSSNWATVCLNTALRAKGNTDVSGLTRRCKNLFAPQRTHRLGWQIHVNTRHKSLIWQRPVLRKVIWVELTGRWP